MSTSLHTAHNLGYYDNNDIWSLLGDYNTLVLALEEIIVNLEETDTATNTEVADLKNRVQVLRDTVENFKVTMQENTTTIDNIRESVKTLKTTVDGYSNRIANAEKNATELSELTSSLSDEISNLTNDVSGNSTKLANLTNSLTNLTTSNNNQHTAMAANIQTAQNTAKSAITQLTTHKQSADHDGRYYTETEVNNILNNLFVSCNGEIGYGLQPKSGQTWKLSEKEMLRAFGLSNYHVIGVIGINTGNGNVVPQEMDITADGSLQVKLYNSSATYKETSAYVKLLFSKYNRTVKNGTLVGEIG